MADLVSCPQEMITAPMSAGAGPFAPPISLQHIYDGIFRGVPSGHVARSASQSIGMASLKLEACGHEHAYHCTSGSALVDD